MNKVNSKAWYINSKYNVPIELLYFEWDKFMPMLEWQFQDALNEMLNHYCQWHLSDQNERWSITPRNRELSNNVRCRINNRTQMLTPLGPRITQTSIRGRFLHGKNFSHNTPEINFNHHQNTQFKNQAYQMTQNSGNAHHSTTFRTIYASCDHEDFHSRRSLQSNSLFIGNFTCEYHNNHINNPNITLNGSGAVQLEQVWYAVNDASLLMADQTITQAAISSVETFDSNEKNWSMDSIAWKHSTTFLSRYLMNSIFKNGRVTTDLSP